MQTDATFKGKSVIVTAAAYGIGRQLALALSRAGARLLLVDAHSEGLRETCDKVREACGEAYAMPLLKPSDSERVFQHARELLGGVDFACFVAEDGRTCIAPVASPRAEPVARRGYAAAPQPVAVVTLPRAK